MRVTPSRIGFGVANVASQVTSRSAPCVRLGKKTGRKEGARGLVGTLGTHAHDPPRAASLVRGEGGSPPAGVAHDGAWRSYSNAVSHWYVVDRGITDPPLFLLRLGAVEV